MPRLSDWKRSTAGFVSGLLPAFGALVGRLTPETICEALVSVPGKNVQHWIKQYLGQTFLSKRRLALQNHRNNSHVNYSGPLFQIFNSPVAARLWLSRHATSLHLR